MPMGTCSHCVIAVTVKKQYRIDCTETDRGCKLSGRGEKMKRITIQHQIQNMCDMLEDLNTKWTDTEWSIKHTWLSMVIKTAMELQAVAEAENKLGEPS